MIHSFTERGFEIVSHGEDDSRLVQESSRMGDNGEAPGDAFLWVGGHELSKDEVSDLIDRMIRWFFRGTLMCLEESIADIESRKKGDGS